MNKKMILGIGYLMAGLIFLICAFNALKKIDVAYEKEYVLHLQEKIKEYRDLKKENEDMADSYGPGFFRSSYNSIADSYQDLIDKSNADIQKYNTERNNRLIKVYILFAFAILFTGSGCYLFLLKTKENNNIDID